MGNIQFWNNQILFDSSAIAMDPACCCDDDACDGCLDDPSDCDDGSTNLEANWTFDVGTCPGDPGGCVGMSRAGVAGWETMRRTGACEWTHDAGDDDDDTATYQLKCNSGTNKWNFTWLNSALCVTATEVIAVNCGSGMPETSLVSSVSEDGSPCGTLTIIISEA